MARQPGNDVVLGHAVDGSGPLVLPRDARDKHLYICGGTGTGKSKLMERLVRQDIIKSRVSECGMLVLDPHGSLYDGVMGWLAHHDQDRPVISIDLRRDDWVVAYNVLRQRSVAKPNVIVDNFVDAMAYVWGETGTDRTPLFARWASNSLRALYERRQTLAEAVHLIDRRAVRMRQMLTSGLSDPLANRDWEYANHLAPRDFDLQIGSTINRMGRFVRNPLFNSMFGQTEVSLDLGTALEEGHIILVCLAREKARVSKEDADTFATMLLSDLWTAAQERGKPSRGKPKPFYVYVDEFQRFVTPTIAENLDEARGYGLHLTLANQFPGQLLNRGDSGKQVYDSIMENATTKVSFRLTHGDNLQPVTEWLFRGVLDPDQVKNILYSTKVVDYRREFLESFSDGETQTEGTSWYENKTRTQSANSAETLSGSYDESDPLQQFEPSRRATSAGIGEAFGTGSGVTGSQSTGRNSSHTVHETLVPVLGKEISQIERRSIEEQLFIAAALLADQKERHFMVRIGDRMRAPVALRTPTVEPGRVSARDIERYIRKRQKKWGFVLPGPEALRLVEARQQKLLESLDSNEPPPESYRRRVK